MKQLTSTLQKKSLEKQIGLPLAWNGKKLSGSALKTASLEEKTYAQYKEFFKNSALDKNNILYYTYRNVCIPRDISVFKKHALRHDITVIPAGTIGEEYIRTIGHIHAHIPHTSHRFTEIYRVIEGKGLFILQSEVEKQIKIIHIKKGDTVILPEKWGHSAVNIHNKKALILVNIFTTAATSDYTFFKKTQGPALYPIHIKNNVTVQQNKNTQKYAIEHLVPSQTKNPLHITKESLYAQFIKSPQQFDFLNKPQPILCNNIHNLYIKK